MRLLNRMLFVLLGLGITCLQFSCSLEKRLHLSGYYVDWHHSKTANSRAANSGVADVSSNGSDASSISGALTTSINNSIIPINTDEIPEFRTDAKHNEKDTETSPNPPDVCDIIILRNGNEVKAKITEVGTSEIKYKKCDNIDGPTYTILKSEVFMIKYKNGTKDVFSNTDKTETKPKTTDENKYVPDYKRPAEYKAKSEQTNGNKELSYSEKYMKGEIDANKYHNGGWWYFAGVFLGLIGILIAALSAPAPHVVSDLSMDPAYRQGYTKTARKQNVNAALIGWLVWLLLFILIISAAAA